MNSFDFVYYRSEVDNIKEIVSKKSKRNKMRMIVSLNNLEYKVLQSKLIGLLGEFKIEKNFDYLYIIDFFLLIEG